MLQLELKLLTSQMNPHFTFNTINSIQHYILKNEKKEAIQYLSDFALLMRKTLDFSFSDLINIKEELDYIELYIELENKRFNKEFLLEKRIDKSIDINNSNIPSLLIQPLIENIILHANYSEHQEKNIKLTMHKHDNYYLISIIDFGVGISFNNKLSNHKSYGTGILKNRLKIYNGIHYLPTDIQFKYTDEINKTGTTVILKLYTNENNHN
jgi:LytS/YehU family sensor histidine kinase